MENSYDNDDASQDEASTENVTDSHESEDEIEVDDNGAASTIIGTKDIIEVKKIVLQSAVGNDAAEISWNWEFYQWWLSI